jgi:hypothetical protein
METNIAEPKLAKKVVQKPWQKIKLDHADNQSYINAIDSIRQGFEGKDNDDNLISKEDAELSVILGIISLRIGAGYLKKNHDVAKNINPTLIKKANELIETNRDKVDEYIKKFKNNNISFSDDKPRFYIDLAIRCMEMLERPH